MLPTIYTAGNIYIYTRNILYYTYRLQRPTADEGTPLSSSHENHRFSPLENMVQKMQFPIRSSAAGRVLIKGFAREAEVFFSSSVFVFILSPKDYNSIINHYTLGEMDGDDDDVETQQKGNDTVFSPFILIFFFAHSQADIIQWPIEKCRLQVRKII